MGNQQHALATETILQHYLQTAFVKCGECWKFADRAPMQAHNYVLVKDEISPFLRAIQNMQIINSVLQFENNSTTISTITKASTKQAFKCKLMFKQTSAMLFGITFDCLYIVLQSVFAMENQQAEQQVRLFVDHCIVRFGKREWKMIWVQNTIFFSMLNQECKREWTSVNMALKDLHKYYIAPHEKLASCCQVQENGPAMVPISFRMAKSSATLFEPPQFAALRIHAPVLVTKVNNYHAHVVRIKYTKSIQMNVPQMELHIKYYFDKNLQAKQSGTSIEKMLPPVFQSVNNCKIDKRCTCVMDKVQNSQNDQHNEFFITRTLKEWQASFSICQLRMNETQLLQFKPMKRISLQNVIEYHVPYVLQHLPLVKDFFQCPVTTFEYKSNKNKSYLYMATKGNDKHQPSNTFVQLVFSADVLVSRSHLNVFAMHYLIPMQVLQVQLAHHFQYTNVQFQFA